MRLSEISTNSTLGPEAHARFPGFHCAFFGVAGTVPLIKNSYALMIGPSICLYNAKLNISLRALSSDPRPDNLLLLPLVQEDIIFGALSKVQQAVVEADRTYHPEVLFVVTTCAQEIIGEDLDAAVEEIRPKIDAHLLLVHTDNFTCEDASPGIERTLLSLYQVMRPGKIVPRSVNLLGLRTPMGRAIEPVRLMEAKGIRIHNVIPSYSTLDDIRRAPCAALNLVMEHHALPLAQKMDEAFGTPYLYLERPYTPDAVESWYRQAAEALDIALMTEVKELKAETCEAIEAARPHFTGKRCVLGVQQGRAFDLVRLMVLLGLQPLLLYANRILPEDWADIRALLDAGIDFGVKRSGDALGNERLLARLQPDYYIGHSDQRTLARLGIAARSLMRVYYTPGFDGTRQALRLLTHPHTGSDILRYKERYIGDAQRSVR